MGLLGLFLAEDANLLERSALTDAEMDSVVNEAAALDPSDQQRQQFVERVNRGISGKNRVVPTDDLTIRAAYSIRAHMLPDAIRQAISLNRLKIVNKAFYKIILFSGKQGDLMLNADTKMPGVTNVNNRKLEQNDYFLLTSIILQSAMAATAMDADTIDADTKDADTKDADAKDADPKAATTTAAAKKAAAAIRAAAAKAAATKADPLNGAFGIPCKEILGGEFSLLNGAKVIVHPSSARIFDTSTRKDVIQGEWKLENPKFIAPQIEIIPELKLAVNVPANTIIKLVLIGAGLEKA